MSNPNLALWESVEKTDPSHTKSFSRGGGFKGTATNATYLAKRATETFGPCGIGWGVKVLSEKYVPGAPLLNGEGQVIGHEMVHVARVQLWYIDPRDEQRRGEIEQYGQTQMVGKNRNGIYTDEEAPKKSITDGMTKCLSLLGFAADIHLGLYDDNKYMAELRREFAEESAPPPVEERRRPARDLGPRMSVADHMKAMRAARSETDLKKAFGLAWKQYENPADPHDRTEAQERMKVEYDKLLAAFAEPAATADGFDIE